MMFFHGSNIFGTIKSGEVEGGRGGGDHDGEEGDKSQRRVIVFHGMS